MLGGVIKDQVIVSPDKGSSTVERTSNVREPEKAYQGRERRDRDRVWSDRRVDQRRRDRRVHRGRQQPDHDLQRRVVEALTKPVNSGQVRVGPSRPLTPRGASGP